MDAAERDRLIDRYAAGYAAIEAALAGITDLEWEAREAPGEWSPREVVHHLADSEMTSAIRVRRLLAEDDPEIVGYDQEAFARRLRYDRPVEGSLAAFRGARLPTGHAPGHGGRTASRQSSQRHSDFLISEIPGTTMLPP